MEDCKVLIIEDDEAARVRLAREVGKEGYNVITAENGLIGVELLAQEFPQIILSDLKMPEMSGLDVLRMVKQSSPETLVILMSAFGDMDTVIEALREGAFDYIKKPIDLNLLTQILKRAKEELT